MQRVTRLKRVINEMDLVLIRGMKMSSEDIYNNPIWPMEPQTMDLSREFFLAVKRNDLKAVRNMIAFSNKGRLLVFEFDSNKRNALMWAVKRNQLEMTLLLVENFSRVDWQDISDKTALHFAV